MVNSAKKATMHDIASRQDVSHTTVSFVLRGRDMGISAEKREGILREAIRMNYRTRSDQRINSQKRKALFLIPKYADIYGRETHVSRLITYLSSIEETSGIQFIVQASPDRNIIRSLYKGICEDQVDIVIPINLGSDELRTVEALSPVPMICMDLWADLHCSMIGFDNEWIGRKAAQHFYEYGHRNAALLSSSLYNDIRNISFMDEWRKLGGRITNIRFKSLVERDIVYKKLLERFKKGYDFTAVWCNSDIMAMTVMQAVYDSGLSVPDDLSIIGCDDHSYSEFSHPALSTFRMDEKIYGQQLIMEIRRLTENSEGTKTIANKADFISRQSVKRLPVDS